MLVRALGVLETGAAMRGRNIPFDVRTTLKIPLGVDFTLRLLILYSEGPPVDLRKTGTSVVWTVKVKPGVFDEKKIEKFGVVNLSEGLGMVDFTLTPQDTKNISETQLVYDIWLTQDGVRNPVIPTSPLRLLSAVTPPP